LLVKCRFWVIRVDFDISATCPVCRVISDIVRVAPDGRHLFAQRSEFASWDQQFFDPITLPGRKPLVTLRDAALYITKLPKAEHDGEEWQAAM
jgi:hypothetical protein